MPDVIDALASLIEIIRLKQMAQFFARAGGPLLLIVGLVVLLEIRLGSRSARYWSRWFLHDVVYSIFYRGGFWSVFITAAVINGLEANMAFLRLGVLSDVPKIPAMFLFWIGGDFFVYWLHRLQHRVPFLWAFHRVHHAAEQISPLSINRHHPVDELLLFLSWFFPMVIVLGIETGHWIPLFLVMNFIEALQHAEISWRFGPLYRIFVSPVFHSIHHSLDRKQHDANYSIHFSMWDYLFGTAAKGKERPAAYGTDPPMAESLLVHLVEPFRTAFRPGSYTVVAAPSRTRPESG